MVVTTITIIAILISALLFFLYVRSGRNTNSDLSKRAEGVDSAIERVGVLEQESENRTSAIKRANEETRLGLDRATEYTDEDARRIARAKELLERISNRVTEADSILGKKDKNEES